MIADFNTIPRKFSECNRKYFGHSLPTPKYGVIHKFNTLALFECIKSKKNAKNPIEFQKISVTDFYDFDEDVFTNLVVHEMIHYYIAWNRIKDNKTHGREFMRIANELNEKYGLNVSIKIDASSFKRTEKAPKRTGLFKFLFG